MTHQMKQNMAGSIDQYYMQFKNVISKGQKLPMDQVDTIAQGHVWSGDQAKTNGLTDKLGGLYRAIAYAQQTHTETGNATIKEWQ